VDARLVVARVDVEARIVVVTVDVDARLVVVEGTEDAEVGGCVVVVVRASDRCFAGASDGSLAPACVVVSATKAFAAANVTNVARLTLELPRASCTRTSARPARWGPTSTRRVFEDRSETRLAASPPTVTAVTSSK
jgi:hypothetical protein